MGLVISYHLTHAYGALELNIRKTYAGQAHFAATGPEGKTCRLCKYWISEGYAASGILKSARCMKYRELTGKSGERFPHSALACKYFIENDKPPTAVRST